METIQNILTLQYLGNNGIFANIASYPINTYTLEYNYFGPFVAYQEEAAEPTFTPIVSWIM